MIEEFKPDRIYHLAAQASVSHSWEYPIDTFSTNVFGGVNLLDSVKRHRPGCRVLAVCTAEEYGEPDQQQAIDEKFPIFPRTPMP
ncbi:MAG: GDP-mannose 4,6-dehydratase [Actinomycetota bacterium]|nr:GDP-mannose 4,6-dehydratase [Actinomycetota bacterium]